jgi:hypothetical protein
MTISQHLTEFAGKTIREWESGVPITDTETMLYRVALSWDESEADEEWTDKFAEFLDDPNSKNISGIVVGTWGFQVDSSRVVEALVSARERLPHLTALFLGDITYDENEISWINQSDMSPLFGAYPQLVYFGVRGGDRLSLGHFDLPALTTLIIQTGGMDANILLEVSQAHLPALEHLELWLGTRGYGWTGTLEDLKPFLTGTQFPELKYLGLRDSEIADDIAVALTDAPILDRLETLDLSLGTLGDRCTIALIDNPKVKKLKKLDIHHHYCTEPIIARFGELGIEVDSSEAESPDQYDDEESRYVAVSE